jgi:hypothetical protein
MVGELASETSPLIVALLPAGPPMGITDMLLPEPLDEEAQAAMITVAAHRPAIAYGLVNDRFSFMGFLLEVMRHPEERSDEGPLSLRRSRDSSAAHRGPSRFALRMTRVAG